MEEDNTNSNQDEHNDEDCEMMHETEDQEEHDTEPTRENEEETVLFTLNALCSLLVCIFFHGTLLLVDCGCCCLTQTRRTPGLFVCRNDKSF